MQPYRRRKLSKVMSYALRHAPEEFGLTLSPQGYVPLDDLLRALEKRGWHHLSEGDIREMMANADKQRFEIRYGLIRAKYGHSVPGIIPYDPEEPPEVLYHGTAGRVAPKILEEGLKPMGRQYVHLSADIPTATEVGRRRDNHPAILRVAAREAFSQGIKFYRVGEKIWTSDPIPPEFIEE